MNLTEKLFVYNGTHSSRYGLRILHIDTEQLKQISGEVTYNSIFHRGLHQKIYTGRTWDESPLEFDIEFVCMQPIHKTQRRQVEKWLFNTNGFKKLYVDIGEDEDIEMWYGEYKQQYIDCVFKSPEVIESGDGIYGWKAVCEITSPMALQDKITLSLSKIESGTTTSINVDTDINDYVLPVITFKVSNSGSDATVTIENKDDNGKIISRMSVSKIPVNSIIQANSIMGTIVSDAIDANGLPCSYYDSLENKQFLKLIPDNNNLTITSEGNTIEDLSIEWQNARWFR